MLKNTVKVHWTDPRDASKQHTVIIHGESTWDLVEIIKEGFKGRRIKGKFFWKNGSFLQRLFWKRMYTIDDLEDFTIMDNSGGQQ